MNRKKIGLFLMIILCSVVASAMLWAEDPSVCVEKQEVRVYELEGRTRFFAEIVKDFDYYLLDEASDCYHLYNKQEAHHSSILFSSPSCDDIIGYEGAIPFAIVLTTEMKVSSIYLFENEETPEWMEMLDDARLLSRWNGLSVVEAAEKRVDIVSGATYSSEAVIESMKRRLLLFKESRSRE